jgi:uncharacterized protein YndB with AHSA1/START domain
MVDMSMSTAQSLGNRPIKKRVLIQATPARVYRALTTARDLVHWFCDRAICHAHVGGGLTASWRMGKASQKGRGIIRKLVVNERVEIEWTDVDGEARPANAHRIFTYSILSRRGSTEVTLHDEDLSPRDEETFNELDEGWNYVLQEFKDHCERKERAAKHSRVREK